MIRLIVHSPVLCSAPQVSAWCLKLGPSTEKKVAAKDVDLVEVEVRGVKAFEVMWMSLFFT